LSVAAQRNSKQSPGLTLTTWLADAQADEVG
jgi:hypothetical protein